MNGLHLIGDMYRCPAEPLRRAEWLQEQCVALCRAAGLTVLGAHFHQFEGEGGVTGTVVLAESHLAIHTWPETGGVTLDVYVCNYTADNTGKAQQLFDSLVDLLKPDYVETHRVTRGQPSRNRRLKAA